MVGSATAVAVMGVHRKCVATLRCESKVVVRSQIAVVTADGGPLVVYWRYCVSHRGRKVDLLTCTYRGIIIRQHRQLGRDGDFESIFFGFMAHTRSRNDNLLVLRTLRKRYTRRGILRKSHIGTRLINSDKAINSKIVRNTIITVTACDEFRLLAEIHSDNRSRVVTHTHRHAVRCGNTTVVIHNIDANLVGLTALCRQIESGFVVIECADHKVATPVVISEACRSCQLHTACIGTVGCFRSRNLHCRIFINRQCVSSCVKTAGHTSRIHRKTSEHVRAMILRVGTRCVVGFIVRASCRCKGVSIVGAHLP